MLMVVISDLVPAPSRQFNFPFPLSFGAMPPVVAFAVGEC